MICTPRDMPVYLMRRLRSSLAIKADHIRADGFSAKLAQHRGHLATMVGAVIGNAATYDPARRSACCLSDRDNRSCTPDLPLTVPLCMKPVLAANPPSVSAAGPHPDNLRRSARLRVSARGSAPARSTARP